MSNCATQVCVCVGVCVYAYTEIHMHYVCFKLKRGRDFEGFASTNFLFSAFSIYNNRLETYSSNSKFLSSVSPLQCIIFYLYVHKLKHKNNYYIYTIHTTTKQQRNIKTKNKIQKKKENKNENETFCMAWTNFFCRQLWAPIVG